MQRSSLFWVLFAATGVLYLVIVGWSLPRIASEAGGATPFDLRPMGYDYDEAQGFLIALSEVGRDYYLRTQHRLDWIYPAFLGATFALGYFLLFRRVFLWLLIPLTICVVGFDWLENLAVAELLKANPNALDPDKVAEASRWSLLKSLATTLAWILLLAGGVLQLLRKRRRGENGIDAK